MSSEWDSLVKAHKDLLNHRNEVKSLLSDRTEDLNAALRRIDADIKIHEERMKKTREAYFSSEESKIEPGIYWARNKFRVDPDQYDMIVEVKEPDKYGRQEWWVYHAEPLNWAERLDYEYKLGDLIAKSRK